MSMEWEKKHDPEEFIIHVSDKSTSVDCSILFLTHMYQFPHPLHLPCKSDSHDHRIEAEQIELIVLPQGTISYTCAMNSRGPANLSSKDFPWGRIPVSPQAICSRASIALLLQKFSQCPAWTLLAATEAQISFCHIHQENGKSLSMVLFNYS